MSSGRPALKSEALPCCSAENAPSRRLRAGPGAGSASSAFSLSWVSWAYLRSRRSIWFARRSREGTGTLLGSLTKSISGDQGGVPSREDQDEDVVVVVVRRGRRGAARRAHGPNAGSSGGRYRGRSRVDLVPAEATESVVHVDALELVHRNETLGGLDESVERVRGRFLRERSRAALNDAAGRRRARPESGIE